MEADDREKGTGQETGSPEVQEPAKKRRGLTKRARAGIGVVAAVVVLAAAFTCWHSQPSFCNAVCHTPMTDSYLETYEAQPGQPATDKWGNEVADASGMLAAVHGHAGSKSIGCIDCHTPVVGQQIGEGADWVSGNYTVAETKAGDVPVERTVTQLAEATGKTEEQFCLRSGCHDMTMDQLMAKTSYMKRNPHSMQHGKLDCGTCHKSHRASVNYCSECHSDATIPQGWLTVAQEKQFANYAAQ